MSRHAHDPDRHDDLDARLTAALRHRAADVHLAPRGLGDVRRRVQRRRRRAATVGAAAVSVPALAGIAWAATRTDPVRPTAGETAGDTAGDTADGLATTLSPDGTEHLDGFVSWRCESLMGGDDRYTYYDTCERVLGVEGPTTTVLGVPDPAAAPSTTLASTDPIAFPTTTLAPFMSWPPVTTTVEVPAGVLTVLVVDATGAGQAGTGCPTPEPSTCANPAEALSQMLVGNGIEYQVGLLSPDRTSPETMVMPVAADPESMGNASILASYLGVDGFDTWTASDWTTSAVSEDLALVVVLGQDWAEHLGLGTAAIVTTTTGP